jgi:hypothetical protein
MPIAEAFQTIIDYETRTPVSLGAMLQEIEIRSGCKAEVPEKEKPDRSYTLGDHIVVEFYKMFTVVAKCEEMKVEFKLNNVIMVYDKITDTEFIVHFRW